jgi:membrane-associated protease RseP (regulator of RpoE activity)
MSFIKRISAICAGIFFAVALATTANAQIFFDSGGTSYVSYNYHTDYADTTGGNFTVTFYTTFDATDFEPAVALASFGVTLTDGTTGGTGVTASNLLQTATLVEVDSQNNVIASSPLAVAQLPLLTYSVSNHSSQTESTQTPSFPGYDQSTVSGTYDELEVTISGTLTQGAQIGATGVVDVEAQAPSSAPEPSGLSLISAVALVLAIYLRKKLNGVSATKELVPVPKRNDRNQFSQGQKKQ